jgi:hypothetical protein
MKQLQYATSIVAALILSGCSSNPAPTMQYVESYSLPRIGTISTRGIGESLIKQETGHLVTELSILADTKIGNTVLPMGPKKYYDQNEFGIWFFERGKYYFYLRRSDNQICIEENAVCATVAHTVERRLSALSTNSFQQTLIYNGRVGNRVAFAYREFSNDLARPAFSNNVEYDMTESTTIGYKGARLEIIKATNTDITYRVVSGFSN